MAYSHQFSERLLQQVNETNARNLHLEALLAQRDDQLAHAQRVLAGQIGGSPPTPANFDFQLQLQEANKRTSNAEANLNSSINTFDKEYKKQQKQIRTLKSELEAARSPNSVTRAPASTEENSRVNSLGEELEKTKSQLQNLKTAYAGLQRQLKAEQKENSRRQNLPRTNPAKAVSIGDDDQDDEEPNPPQIKQESSGSISYGSSSMLSPPPQPSRPRTRSFQSSVFSSRRHSASSNMGVILAHRPKVDPNTTRESSTVLPNSDKRRRSTYGEDNLQEDVEGVADSDRDDPAPPRKRTRGSRGGVSLTYPGPRDDDHEDLKRRLSFLGITSYDDQGRPGGFNARELDDCMPMLWERIRMIVNLWEEKTEAWKETIEDKVKMSKNKTPICVSSKLKIEGRAHGNSKWREGCEGKYACRKCVEENVPCFTWTGEEFRLLPLHEMDRKYPDRKDHEIRFWLNEA